MTDKPNADRLPSTLRGKRPSYDDLVRRLVPLPDSSHRPTTDEEQAAEVRPNAADGPDETIMRDTLQRLRGVDIADVQVDVVGHLATVSGSVARGYDRDRVVAALHAVPGVTEVIDQLRIRLA